LHCKLIDESVVNIIKCICGPKKCKNYILYKSRYLEDYEGFTDQEFNIFQMEKDEKSEAISQNPISAFRMLRRFVVNLKQISSIKLKLLVSSSKINSPHFS